MPTYGSANGDGDSMNRLDAIKDDNSGSPGSTLASYEYLGAGTVVEIDYEEPDVRLDLIGSGNSYSGFDRFMRIVDQKWYDYGAGQDRDRYKYGYDRASNRTYRENTTTSAKDEFYTYDGMHRLKNMDRGNLNAGKSAISGTPVREYDWNLDPTGNWETVVKKSLGVTDYNQSRDHNKVNEITSIDDAKGSSSGAADWVEPVFDRNGNMTTMPQPASPTSSYTADYDAWNRLVEVLDGTTVAAYVYDGLNRRISKDVDSTVRHFYYSASWRVVEERIDSSSNAESQNIFGPRYVDELILRDRDTDANGSLDERFYYLQDANFNVTTLTDDAGDAVERYNYMPYGEVDVHTGAWGSRGASSYNNRYMFTGREFDSESGLFMFRNRIFESNQGRFLSRDPAEYSDAINLYAGVFVPNQVDPNGLEKVEPRQGVVVEPCTIIILFGHVRWVNQAASNHIKAWNKLPYTDQYCSRLGLISCFSEGQTQRKLCGDAKRFRVYRCPRKVGILNKPASLPDLKTCIEGAMLEAAYYDWCGVCDCKQITVRVVCQPDAANFAQQYPSDVAIDYINTPIKRICGDVKVDTPIQRPPLPGTLGTRYTESPWYVGTHSVKCGNLPKNVHLNSIYSTKDPCDKDE